MNSISDLRMEEILGEIGKFGPIQITGPGGWGASGWKVTVGQFMEVLRYEGKELRPLIEKSLKVVRAIQGVSA